MKKLLKTTDISPYMDVIGPKLIEACSHSLGRYAPQDVLEFINNGFMQLWLAFDDNELDGLILTQIVKHPGKDTIKFLCVLSFGGWQVFVGKIRNWMNAMQEVENWGISMGCTLSQVECPSTWAYYLKDFGYKNGHILMDKEL